MTDAEAEMVIDEGQVELIPARKVGTRFVSRYYSMLKRLGNKPTRIRIPTGVTLQADDEVITRIPKISDPNVEEVEMISVSEPFTYVRITYNNATAEYIYEVIEPELNEDELELLEVLKDSLIVSLNHSEFKKPEDRGEVLLSGAERVLKEFDVELNEKSKDRILYYLRRDFIGYGVMDVMMIDPNVEDISCDGVDVPFFIYHRKYGSIKSNIRFDKEMELDAYVVWIAQKSGKHISVAEPMLDATIPNGSRLNATLSKHVTKHGSSITVRRFKESPFTPIDLVKFKTLSTEMMAYLWISVEFGSSMLVCGGTASGKTTTLNAILLLIPPQMKIVSIEDTRELNLPHENWIPSLTREGFGGKSTSGGTINMFDLLTAALRQRPQYMMVGEVRGQEAYVVFQAMATGHTSYSTFHAEDVQSMVHRLESEPINLPRALLTALDIVLLQAQVKVGTALTRRIKSLTEIVGMDPDTGEVVTNSVYTWNPADDTFAYSGHSYVYEKVRTARNWSTREMEREVKRRMDILEYMRMSGVQNYRQVANIVSSYYKDPKALVDDIRAKMADKMDGESV